VKTLQEEGREEGRKKERKDSAPDFPAKIVIVVVIVITVQRCPIQSCIIALHYLMEIAKTGPYQTLPHALKRDWEF
jgi:hypothetical protein